METREYKQAIIDLEAAGYTIVPYPDSAKPTNLIVRLVERTVTTLPVTKGAVCEDSVAYLISEGHYDAMATPRG